MEPLRCLRFLGFLVLIGSSAHAQDALMGRQADRTSSGDLYAANTEVRIATAVAGDLTVAGAVVAIDAEVKGDLNAAGARLSLSAPVADDVRVAGRDVWVSAPVGDHLVAAGENVVLDSRASVGDFAWIAGQKVRIAGRIGGTLKVWAQEVTLAGEILGPVELTAERIILLPETRIAGDLVWYSAEAPKVSSAAQIAGKLIARPPPEEFHPRVAAIISAVVFVLAVVLVAITLYLLFPRASDALADTVMARPAVAAGLGLAVFAATPILIVLLIVTVIGIPLGLLLLWVYLLALPLAWFGGAFTAAKSVLTRGGWSASRTRGLAALALTVLLLCLLQIVPFLGFFASFAVLLAGLGGIGLLLARAR